MSSRDLKRGEVVRRSVQGARGFFYPDKKGKAIMVREDCVATQQVGWNTCEDYVAYHVPSTAFAEKDRYDNSARNMIVWVQRNG